MAECLQMELTGHVTRLSQSQ